MFSIYGMTTGNGTTTSSSNYTNDIFGTVSEKKHGIIFVFYQLFLVIFHSLDATTAQNATWNLCATQTNGRRFELPYIII
jgi:hypothetical protein